MSDTRFEKGIVNEQNERSDRENGPVRKGASVGKNQQLLETGSFRQLIVKLSLPAVVVILIMIVYNMADTYFIGQTGDPNKISAISICMPVFTILSGIGTLFGNGGGTTASIALGEKNEQKIKNISAFCAFGGILVGIVFGFCAFFFTRPIVLFLGADKNTMDFAIIYLKVFALASPFVLFSQSMGNIVRADGDATGAMLASTSGSLLNIVLDALFVLVFKWDVFGAALATVIGNVFSTVLILYILKKKPSFFPSPRNLVWKKEIIIPVLTLGLPMTFSTVLSSVSNTISNRLMISHGSVCLAAQSIAGKMGMVITMLIMGFCMGMQPAISYNYGAKSYKRMYQVVRDTAVFTVVLGIVLTIAIFFTKDTLVTAFIDNEEVISYGSVFVLASVLVGPIYGIYQICQTFLQATGKVNYAIFISLLDKGIVYIPVLFIMNMVFGAYGIAFSHAVTMIFSLLIAVVLAVKWGMTLKQ